MIFPADNRTEIPEAAPGEAARFRLCWRGRSRAPGPGTRALGGPDRLGVLHSPRGADHKISDTEDETLSSSEGRPFGLPPPERAVRDESEQPPQDPSLWLTVPKLERVEDVPVTIAPSSDDRTLDVGPLHVEGTGFP